MAALKQALTGVAARSPAHKSRCDALMPSLLASLEGAVKLYSLITALCASERCANLFCLTCGFACGLPLLHLNCIAQFE